MIAPTIRAAGLALMLAAGSAMAQQPAPAAPPAALPNFSASHLDAARQLVTEAGLDGDKSPISAILDEMRKQVVGTFATTRPELKNDLEQVLNGMVPQIAEKKEQIIDVAVKSFAVRFSEKEIGEILAFLKTPVGQKYLREQPAAMNDFFSSLQVWVRSMNEFVVTTVRAEMKKKGHDL